MKPICLLWLLSGVCSAQTVALTFDDLPGTPAADQAILNTLARHHAKAIGFVNQKRVSGPAMVNRWIAAGHELGNHGYSHADLNALTETQFEQEVIEGEGGRSNRYFRYPFNHTGETKQKHDAAAAFLKARGYRIAVCTIDNSDYLFARTYDKTQSARVADAYVDYTANEIDYYTGLHKQIFGRAIPHVMLLHANRLNADTLDRVLGLFEARGYRYVTIGEAQSDAAYQTPDTFITKFGPMWGYRWAQVLGVKVNGKLEPEPPAWIENLSEKQ